MWIAKLLIRHDCIIGNRCKKYRCISMGYPLEHYYERGYYYYLHFEKIIGKEKKVKEFIADLKKDPAVVSAESSQGVVFFSCKCKRKGRMPAQQYLKKVFYLKPVVVDEKGYEHWEVATWSRKNLNEFMHHIKRETQSLDTFKIIKIVKTKLKEIYFPQVFPSITDAQKKALELAVQEGYYNYPRGIELRALAQHMRISLSTYREHLRKAEKKMLASL